MGTATPSHRGSIRGHGKQSASGSNSSWNPALLLCPRWTSGWRRHRQNQGRKPLTVRAGVAPFLSSLHHAVYFMHFFLYHSAFSCTSASSSYQFPSASPCPCPCPVPRTHPPQPHLCHGDGQGRREALIESLMPRL